MTADYSANQYDELNFVPHSAGEVYVMDDVVEVDASLTLGDLCYVGVLPAGCVPLDVTLITDELDTHGTDTLTMSVGLLNSTENDLVAASTFITGALADATVNVTRGNAVGMMGIAPTTADRIVAIKVTAAAATAAAGGARVIMTYRASNYGA